MSLFNRKTGLGRLGSVVFALVLLIHPISLLAQSTYASITGAVTDPHGAVVSGAKVTIVNKQTQAARTITTNNEGVYLAANLDAGIYSITVEATGFNKPTKEGVELLARQVVRADIRLEVAATTDEQINVTAGTIINADSPTIDDSKSGSEINRLALNFRATNNTSPIVVATLTPGVQQDSGGNLSIAGGQPYTTSSSIDGISTLNTRFNGPVRDLFPSVEGIAEFKVSSANNNAEFAQVTDITAISKSGANDYHGAGYWFHQNRALNATNPFAPLDPNNPGHRQKAALVANDFGAVFNGPISIPGLYDGRNRSFFFFDYEGTRRPNQVQLTQSVPSMAFRSGDLSSVPTPIINPLTGTPFVNNQVPVNPVSAKILSTLYENPNQSGNLNNFVTNVPGSFTVNGYDIRGDHSFGEQHKIFVRFTHKDLNNIGTDGTSGYNTKNGAFTNGTEVRNVAGSYNFIISPNVINEFRAGLSISRFTTAYPLAAQGGQIIKDFGLTGLPPTPASGGIPNFNFTDGTFISTSPGRPRNVSNNTYQFTDNLTWIKGKHTFKGGFDFQRLDFKDILTFFNGDEFGEYFFTGAITGNAFADFLLGLPSATTFAQNGPDTNPFTNNYAWYFQDDWKVNSRLTVNLGLRYELHPPFNDKTNQLANFDRFFAGGRVVVQNQQGLNLVAPTFKASIGSTPIVLADQAGLPETLRFTYKKDFDPRVGFAFRPFDNNNTVVRGGFGVYTVTVLGSVLYSLAGVATSNAPVFQNALTPTGPALVFPNVFPSGAGGASGIPDFRRANQIDLKDPATYQWNLTFEHQLGWNTGVRFSYVGSHTINLVHSPDLNQVKPNTTGYTPAVAATRPFPNFNAVLTRDNGPSAKYNAFTAEVSKRFGSGLTFQNSYTFAKNLSNAGGPAPNGFAAENGPTTLNIFNIAADYGNVAFTRRHRFVSTFLWELPIGKGRRFVSDINRMTDLVVGGWDITGITLFQTGPFLTPTFSGTDPSGTGVLVRGVTTTQRPDRVGDGNISDPTAAHYFDRSAFVVPGNNIGRFGNAGVGILEGPGTKVFSMTLGKKFTLTERVSLRYEAAFANVFNHTNLGLPTTLNISSANFGVIRSTQSAEQAGPRTIQMSLRLSF